MISITFRTTGVWGAGTGARLDAVDVDTNFYNLKTAVEAIQANPPDANDIANIFIDGTQLHIVMEDATEFVVTVPQAPFRPSVVSAISADTDNTFTPTSADANCYKLVTDPDGLTVYLTSDIAKDTEFTFDLAVDATIDFVAGDTDADLSSPYGPPAGFLAQISTVGAVVTAKALGSGKWRLIGLLDEDVTA